MKVSGKQCIGHLPEEIFRGVVAGNESLSYLTDSNHIVSINWINLDFTVHYSALL